MIPRSIQTRDPVAITTLLVVVLSGVVIASLGAWRWVAQSRAAYEHQLLHKGEMELARGNLPGAVTWARQLESLPLTQPRSWQFLAIVAENSGDPGRAIEILKRWMRQQPDQAATAWGQFAAIELRRQNGPATQSAIAAALRLDPLEPMAWRTRAELATALGHEQERKLAWLKVIQRGAISPGELADFGKSTPPPISQPQYEKLAPSFPRDQQPVYGKAVLAFAKEDYQQAVQILESIPATSPEYWDAQQHLGRWWAEQDPARFVPWNQQLSKTADEYAGIWLARGLWLKRQGEIDSAGRALWESIRRSPETPGPLKQLGEILLNRSEEEVGQQFLERDRLQRKIDELLEVIDQKQSLELVSQLLPLLEEAGRIWEASAWVGILQQSQQGPSRLDELQQRYRRFLKEGTPQTLTEAIPGRELNWSSIAWPDWSKFKEPSAPSTPAVASTIHFENKAAELGLDFIFQNSNDPQKSGRRIFESTGGGVGVIDYDVDGWPDFYFPQAGAWPVNPATAPSDSLYRNRLGERCENVSVAARIDERLFGQGVTVGDFDNDGFPDLYVANIGRNTLWRNNGDGTLTDITEQAGLQDQRWTVSTAMADFNNDGHPDLFDVNYLEQGEAFTLICTDDKGNSRVCRPEMFEAEKDRLLLNQGDGSFTAFQNEVGLDLPHGVGLGIVVDDFNNDQRLDIFVANDQTPNFLLINRPAENAAGLTFTDEGIALGVGLDRDGYAQACMGVASGDINHDGQTDLFVTNFANESNTLYLSHSDGSFSDETRAAQLRMPSFALLGFGTQFLDADNDGWLDLAILNGHIDDFRQSGQAYKMRPQLFQGRSDGTFSELSGPQAGAFLDQPALGRGLATCDFNRDGCIDFVASDLEGPSLLAINQTAVAGRALQLRLIATSPQRSRDAIGTRIDIELQNNGQARQMRLLSGDGYEASNQRLIRLGLGSETRVKRVSIQWPSGKKSEYFDVDTSKDWLAIEDRPDLLLSTSVD